MHTSLILPERPDLDGLQNAWLDEKKGRSGSERTRGAYARTLDSYLAELRQHGLDWNDAGMAGQIATMIQGWAGVGARKKSVSAATYNHRTSIVSSFYEYAARRGLVGFNPANLVARRVGEPSNYAEPLQPGEIRARLAAIDRSNLIGMRDYAVLVVGLFTGRRVSEIANLAWCDVQFSAETATLHFRRTKGGKEKRDQLPARVAEPLREYLDGARAALVDAEVEYDEQAPIWLGFSPRLPLQPAGRSAIAGICERWLFTRQTHTLRHSFALMMQTAGATVYDIQASLGHANAITTEVYLKTRIERPANKYAGQLADMLDL